MDKELIRRALNASNNELSRVIIAGGYDGRTQYALDLVREAYGSLVEEEVDTSTTGSVK